MASEVFMEQAFKNIFMRKIENKNKSERNALSQGEFTLGPPDMKRKKVNSILCVDFKTLLCWMHYFL